MSETTTPAIIKRRSIPDRLRWLAGKLLEDADVSLVAIALDATATELDARQVVPAAYCARCDVYYGPRSHNGRTGDPYCAECGMELAQVSAILVKAEPGEGEQG